MQIAEAVLRVLEEESRPLHSTVIQDLALRRGYLDPFEHPHVRRDLLAALTRLAEEGAVDRVGKGVYAKPA
jgi:hypothetical protein